MRCLPVSTRRAARINTYDGLRASTRSTHTRRMRRWLLARAYNTWVWPIYKGAGSRCPRLSSATIYDCYLLLKGQSVFVACHVTVLASCSESHYITRKNLATEFGRFLHGPLQLHMCIELWNAVSAKSKDSLPVKNR